MLVQTQSLFAPAEGVPSALATHPAFLSRSRHPTETGHTVTEVGPVIAPLAAPQTEVDGETECLKIRSFDRAR